MADELFESYRQTPVERQAECLAVLGNEPAPFYDEPRERWLVSRYADVRSVLRDRRLSNDLSRARKTTKSARLAARLAPSAPAILFLDPPLHTEVRRVLSERVSGGAVRDRAGEVHERASNLVSTLADGSVFDLGADLVHPLAVEALFALLGFAPVTADARSGFVDDLFSINRLFDLRASEADVERGREGSRRLRARIVAELERPGGLGDAFGSAQVPADVALASVEFVFRAGVVTASCLHANALVACAEGRAARPRNREELERLIVLAAPALEAGRVATGAIEVGGTEIPSGETIISLLPAANLVVLQGEAAVYGRHVAFGAGRHFCIGAELVRVELDALLRAIASSGRTLVVDAIDERHDTPTFRGIRRARARLLA